MKLRKILQGKIHGATVTHADLNYEGSISIHSELLKASSILPGENVWVWNVTNGNRFETYTILGNEPGVISVNGAAARQVHPGDTVIIAAYALMDEESALAHSAKVVFVDKKNLIKELRPEVPGPQVSGFKVPGSK